MWYNIDKFLCVLERLSQKAQVDDGTAALGARALTVREREKTDRDLKQQSSAGGAGVDAPTSAPHTANETLV